MAKTTGNVASQGGVMVGAFREFICALIRRDDVPLTTYQLAVFLTCYTTDPPHTVRGLAKYLNVSKSVITRALDRLAELDLGQRAVDTADRRSINVARTGAGNAMIDAMRRRAEAICLAAN